MPEPLITVDDRLWPLVVQVHRPGFTDADVDAMMRAYERLWMRAARYVLLVYSEPGAPVLNVHQRKRLGLWNKQHGDAIRRANIGAAIVLDSAILRATMTAIHWVAPPTSPQQAFATKLEALDWCIRALEGAGLDVTPDIRALHHEWQRKRVPTFGR